MAHGILLHEPTDDVGVAVRDLKSGEEIGAVTLE
ncbi:partial (2R)-sulfolactate sulfo-lyase subunit alpha, partial [Anaerolineae bacterium]